MPVPQRRFTGLPVHLILPLNTNRLTRVIELYPQILYNLIRKEGVP
jgi:hypothetical protein